MIVIICVSLGGKEDTAHVTNIKHGWQLTVNDRVANVVKIKTAIVPLGLHVKNAK